MSQPPSPPKPPPKPNWFRNQAPDREVREQPSAGEYEPTPEQTNSDDAAIRSEVSRPKTAKKPAKRVANIPQFFLTLKADRRLHDSSHRRVHGLAASQAGHELRRAADEYRVARLVVDSVRAVGLAGRRARATDHFECRLDTATVEERQRCDELAGQTGVVAAQPRQNVRGPHQAARRSNRHRLQNHSLAICTPTHAKASVTKTRQDHFLNPSRGRTTHFVNLVRR